MAIDGVSIIISAYKASEFIEECLDSILGQSTSTRYEVILGVDGCKDTLDKIKSILYKYRSLNIRLYYSKKNVGVYIMFNSLIKESTYSYFTTFGADDTMSTDHIENNSKYLPLYDCVIPRGIGCVDGKDINEGRNHDGVIFLKKDLFESINGYEDYRCGMDSDLLMRLSLGKTYKVYRNKIPTYRVRIHSESLTHCEKYGFDSEYREHAKEIIRSRDNPKINSYKTTKMKYVFNEESIIVTMTSWKKRIGNAHKSIELLLNNTRKPDKFILNLSTDEFPLKEGELPTSILSLKDKYPNFEIYWVKENTKPYKKIIPTLSRFPHNPVISTDDDISYPPDFIERIYNDYLKYNKSTPITGSTHKWVGDMFNHHGAFTLVTGDMFGPYLDDLYNNVVMKYGVDVIFNDDPVLTYAMLLNDKRYKCISGINMVEVRSKDGNDEYSISQYGKEYLDKMNNEHNIIKKYIEDTYRKTYKDLIKDKVFVNFTTFPKRDKYVPKMLLHFKKQTLTPNKIILWLSDVEYNKNNIPSHLKKCISDGLLSEIRFVKGNSLPHKRWDTFKVNNDAYNIMIDDDLYYNPTFVEELYNAAKIHGNCVINYMCSNIEYNNGMRNFTVFTSLPSINNTFLSGMSCFPPHTFPVEMFKYEKYRDIISPNCDDSWVNAWLISRNTKIVGLHRRDHCSHIEGTQENTLWDDNGILIDGTIQNKVRKFARCLSFLSLEEVAKSIWPRFNIPLCIGDDFKYRNFYKRYKSAPIPYQ